MTKQCTCKVENIVVSGEGLKTKTAYHYLFQYNKGQKNERDEAVAEKREPMGYPRGGAPSTEGPLMQ